MPEPTKIPILNKMQDSSRQPSSNSDCTSKDSTDAGTAHTVSSLHTKPLAPKQTDLGKRVVFYTAQEKERYGTLRYYGKLEFADGDWCGIELDEPTGKNNGSVKGIRYFSCEPSFGLFVQLSKVEIDNSRRATNKMRSGIPRTISLSGISAKQDGLYRKASVPTSPVYKPPKAISHLHRRLKGGELKKSRSEWDLSTATNSNGLGALSKLGKKEMGSFSNLADVGGYGDGFGRRKLRSTTSQLNLITVKSPRKERPTNAETMPQIRHMSLSNWQRTSTPNSGSSSCGSTPTSSRSSTLSDSDRTARSTSTSPFSDAEHSPTFIPIITPSTVDRAFILSPDANPPMLKEPSPTKLRQPSSSRLTTTHSPEKGNNGLGRVPMPIGLATRTFQFLENSKSFGGASLSEPTSPSPDHGQLANKKFLNKSLGTATLNHPLSLASGKGGGDGGAGGGGSQIYSNEDITQIVLQLSQMSSCQDKLMARILELEHELRDTRAELTSQHKHFTQQIQAAESRFQCQLSEVEKEHKLKLKQAVKEHDQEIRVLQLAHQYAIKELTKDEYGTQI